MKKNFGFFGISFLTSTVFALCVVQLSTNAFRKPAGAEKNEPFELQIQSLGLDQVSHLPELNHVFVRAIFNNEEIYEFAKRDPMTVARGEKRSMDFKIEIKDSWIKGDTLEFRLEVVRNTTLSPVMVRCATISKGLSTYNRSYQCMIPGENSPVLSYRLARRGSVPVGPLALNR